MRWLIVNELISFCSPMQTCLPQIYCLADEFLSSQMLRTDTQSVCGTPCGTPPRCTLAAAGSERTPAQCFAWARTRCLTTCRARRTTWRWLWTRACCPTGRRWGARPSTRPWLQRRRSRVRLPSVSRHAAVKRASWQPWDVQLLNLLCAFHWGGLWASVISHCGQCLHARRI